MQSGKADISRKRNSTKKIKNPQPSQMLQSNTRGAIHTKWKSEKKILIERPKKPSREKKTIKKKLKSRGDFKDHEKQPRTYQRLKV